MAKFIVKILIATIVAMGMACVAIWCDASDNTVLCTLFFGAALVALALGAFDEPEREEPTKHGSIKHYDGRRNYGNAAVFIGTACLFIGTPKQCEQYADDLQHYAQNARVVELSGDETLEIL